MRDILEGLYNTEDEKGRHKAAWCSFFFYLFLVLSFVISIIASLRCTKSYINKTLFTYKFPMYKGETNFPAGVPVSLDFEGYVQRGAGFGIYRGVYTNTGGEQMINLKSEVIANGKLLVAAFDGYLRAFVITEDNEVKKVQDFALSQDRYYNTRKIDHLIKLNETKVIVVANNGLLPVTITLTTEGKDYKVSFVEGKTLYIIDSKQSVFPHVDNLDNVAVAFIYEQDYKIMTGVAWWIGEGKDATFEKSSSYVAEEKCIYQYHGIAGLSKDRYIIGATGYADNGTGIQPEKWEPHPTRVKLVMIQERELVFTDWVVRAFSDSTNWFAFDNFNERQALITYYDETEGNGIVTMGVFLNDKRDGVYFGGYTIIESGGALIPYTHTTMRILSPRRFGVFFPDASYNGNLIFMMGELTSNNDITRVGANFVVARKERGDYGAYFYYTIAPISFSRFALLDFYKGNSQNYYSLAIGYHLAYPVGITTDRSSKAKYIQFNGVYKVPHTKLIPGRTYYTNSKGDLVAGRPYGYNHAEFGSFYVDDRETQQVMALHNQIGIAVSETELLIRTY